MPRSRLVLAVVTAATAMLASGAVSAGPAAAGTAAAPALIATLTTPSRAVYPARTAVTVVVTSGSAKVAGVTVRVFARPAGGDWVPQYTGVTNSNGVVSVALWIGSTTGYYAVADKSGYAEDVSNSTGVEFFPAVNITAMAGTVSKGHRISFSGNEFPESMHELPVIQVAGPRQSFHYVATASSVDRYGRWVASWLVPTNRTSGPAKVRAILVANPYHAQGTSSSWTLTIL